VKRVVDRTAPCGSPAGGNLGVDDASLTWTVKDLSSKNALMINRRYGGWCNVMSL